MSAATRLVADVGGTNTRLALYDETAQQMRALATYINREHASLEDIIAQWLGKLREPAPARCCIAAAAPPSGDRAANTISSSVSH